MNVTADFDWLKCSFSVLFIVFYSFFCVCMCLSITWILMKVGLCGRRAADVQLENSNPAGEIPSRIAN